MLVDTISKSLLVSLSEDPYDHSEPNQLIHDKRDLRSFNSTTCHCALCQQKAVAQCHSTYMTLSFNTVYDTLEWFPHVYYFIMLKTTWA